MHGSLKAAGVGIEPTPPGSKPGITTSSNYPASFHRGTGGTRTRRWCLTGTCSAAELPTQSSEECSAGIEPASPGWKPGAFAARPRAHRCQRKERESNPQGFDARPLSKRLPSPIGLPFRTLSCGGRNRTCVVAVNSRPPVPARAPPHHQSGWLDSNQRSRAPDARAPECQAFPHPETKSAQRESNPHIRHGKAVGCRYIMGACCVCQFVKDQEHRVGVEPTSPPYECGVLATRRPVQSSGTRGT